MRSQLGTLPVVQYLLLEILITHQSVLDKKKKVKNKVIKQKWVGWNWLEIALCSYLSLFFKYKFNDSNLPIPVHLAHNPRGWIVIPRALLDKTAALFSKYLQTFRSAAKVKYSFRLYFSHKYHSAIASREAGRFIKAADELLCQCWIKCIHTHSCEHVYWLAILDEY